MNKKLLYAIIGGVLAAGLICFIVALIVFFTVKGNAISALVSMFAMAAGAIISVAALIVLIIVIIVQLITKSKNK